MPYPTPRSDVPDPAGAARPSAAPTKLRRLWLLLRSEGARAAARVVLENSARSLGPEMPQRVRRWYLRREAERFDRQHGTDTMGFIDSGHVELGDYEASDEESFIKILDSIPVTPGRTTFLDIGCGKGKAALLASRLPFREVIGVERSEGLCRIARRNVRVWQKAVTEIRIVEADATRLEFPPGPLLLYLFNPFGPQTLERFLYALQEAVESTPRPVVMAYYHALYADVVEGFDWLQPLGPERLLLHGGLRVWANARFLHGV